MGGGDRVGGVVVVVVVVGLGLGGGWGCSALSSARWDEGDSDETSEGVWGGEGRGEGVSCLDDFR